MREKETRQTGQRFQAVRVLTTGRFAVAAGPQETAFGEGGEPGRGRRRREAARRASKSFRSWVR
jgi:hypothetical protein